MLHKKNKHLEKTRSKRKRGKYKKTGLVFIIFGFLLILGAVVLLPLYYFGLIFQNNLYITPVPLLTPKQQVSAQAINQMPDLQNLLTKADLPYTSVKEVSGGYDVKLETGGEVVFASNKDLGKQISSLQLVTQRLTIEGKRFTRLDFRYEDPIITIVNK